MFTNASVRISMLASSMEIFLLESWDEIKKYKHVDIRREAVFQSWELFEL